MTEQLKSQQVKRSRAPVFAKVVAIAAVASCAYRIYDKYVLAPRRIGPRTVDVRIDDKLFEEDAWRTGTQRIRDYLGSVDVEIDALREQDGRHLIIVRSMRETVSAINEIRLWLTLDSNGRPSASAQVESFERSGYPRWPCSDLEGTVRLSSSVCPRANSDSLLVVAYTLTGDCAGSPVTTEGKIALSGDDLR